MDSDRYLAYRRRHIDREPNPCCLQQIHSALLKIADQVQQSSTTRDAAVLLRRAAYAYLEDD